MKITLLAKSSSRDEPYKVDFVFDKDKLMIKCNCPAGRFGKFCKHKWGLIKGNYDMLYEEDQDDRLDKINDWIQNSQYLDLIFEMSKAQKRLDEAQEVLNKIKKKAAASMKKGLNKGG